MFAALLTPSVLLLLPLLPVLYYVLPFLRARELLSVPGPLAARFSNLWLMYQARRGRRYMAVHEAHARYGKVVRIAPNHVSVADVGALGVVYGHGGGFLKR